MKCITVTKFGEVEDVIEFVSDFPKPILIPGSQKMLIKVLACSTSPGDYRTMIGSVDFIRHPPFPYIPSQDICGIIEEIDPEYMLKNDSNLNKKTMNLYNHCKNFKVGDCIISSWDEIALGGMAEYILIDIQSAILKPSNITPIEAAALANSAIHAMLAIEEANIQKEHRVLVLGGSSAVGTIIIQFLKKVNKVSFLASTSSDIELLKLLNVDYCINYQNEKWYEINEFRIKPFDRIIDCSDGISGWNYAKHNHLLKTRYRDGLYLAIIHDQYIFDIHSLYQAIHQLWNPIIGRPFYTRLNMFLIPKYKFFLGGNRLNRNVLKEFFDKYIETDIIQVILDPSSPYEFTQKSVQEAYRKQGDRKAHGKLVVQICES